MPPILRRFPVTRAPHPRSDVNRLRRLHQRPVPSIFRVVVGIQRNPHFIHPFRHFPQMQSHAIHPPHLNPVDIHVRMAFPGHVFPPGIFRRKPETRQFRNKQIRPPQLIRLQPEINRHRPFRFNGAMHHHRPVRLGNRHPRHRLHRRAVPVINPMAVSVQLNPDFPHPRLQLIQIKPRPIYPPDLNLIHIHVRMAFPSHVFRPHAFRRKNKPLGNDPHIHPRHRIQLCLQRHRHRRRGLHHPMPGRHPVIPPHLMLARHPVIPFHIHPVIPLHPHPRIVTHPVDPHRYRIQRPFISRLILPPHHQMIIPHLTSLMPGHDPDHQPRRHQRRRRQPQTPAKMPQHKNSPSQQITPKL